MPTMPGCTRRWANTAIMKGTVVKGLYVPLMVISFVALLIAQPLRSALAAESLAAELAASSQAAAAPAGFRLPFTGQHDITAGPGCLNNHRDALNKEAIDFGLLAGTPVVAAASGTVYRLWDAAGGNVVLIWAEECLRPSRQFYRAAGPAG